MARSVLVTVGRVTPRRPQPIAAIGGVSGSGAGGSPALWAATIHGEPPARRRMHEVVLADGAARLVKSRPARLWQSRAMAQLLNRRPVRPLAMELALECRIC